MPEEDTRRSRVHQFWDLVLALTGHELDDDSSVVASTLRSMVFCNPDKSTQPQLLCDFLMEIGTCSTSITDADSGTESERPIFQEPDNAEDWGSALYVEITPWAPMSGIAAM